MDKIEEAVHLETEPIFGIHITFCDGSKPIEYFNLNLKQTAVVLQEWSEEWILSPVKDCKLNDLVWKWNASPRKVKPTKTKNIEDYADILDPNYIPEAVIECEED